MKNEKDWLSNALIQYKIKPYDLCLERLWLYYENLAQWNQHYGFVKVAQASQLMSDHILDVLAAYPFWEKWLEPKSTIVDVGTGVGLPGLVLSLVLKGHWTGIEPKTSRVQFLKYLQGCYQWNYTIAHTQWQQVKKHYDFITFRAFQPIDTPLLNAFKKLSHAHTKILAYTAKPLECSQWNVEPIPLEVPHHKTRFLCVFTPQ